MPEDPVVPLVPPEHAPATTTKQQDLIYEGQRKVNLIWEYTQAIIAVAVVTTTMGVSAFLAIKSPSAPLPPTINGAFFLVVGFYFSRTNHTNIGGVGPRPGAKMYQGSEETR